MIKDLMASRRFAPLFWCQMLSALNDNFLKNALVIIILARMGADGGALITIAGAIFIAPFVLLSGLGGEIADKHDKATIAGRLKLAEVGAAMVAAAGFYLSSIPVLMTALGLFGLVSALFGPIKYGILPQALKTSEITTGNALVEMGTFAAIIAGTVAGGAYAASGDNGPALAAVIVALSLACWGSALLIPRLGASAPGLAVNWNVLASTTGIVRDAKADKRIWQGTLITSWFWLVGSVALSLLPTLVKERIGGTESVVTALLVMFALGIAIGSGIAARVSHARPNLALVPMGSVTMALSALLIGASAHGMTPAAEPIGAASLLASPAAWPLAIGLIALAIGGGLYIVPAFAALQGWAPEERKARVIAAGNIVSALFIVGGAVVTGAAQAMGAGTAALFAILGAATLASTAYVVRAWGREGMRDVGGMLFKLIFRVEVNGMENIPAPGTPMVIAPNHVSLVDGPLLHSILPIDASFAVDTGIAKAWWAKPFMKAIKHYTMDPSKPLATRHLVRAVREGEPLVIFPEGRVTVTGSLMKVYDGAAMIADKAGAVVVPVRIEGAQRSLMSYLRDSQAKRSLFPKVTVTVLPPVKLAVDEALRGKHRRIAAGEALQDVMTEAMVASATLDRTLFEGLLHAKATNDTGKPAVEDALGNALTYKKLVLGSLIMGRKLETFAPKGGAVGVLLPNSVGAAVTFFGLQAAGRVPAMLNFSAGPSAVLSAVQTAKVTTVLSSRAFVEKGRLEKVIAAIETVARIVYLEDVKAKVGFVDKLRAIAHGDMPLYPRKADDPAVILFTSGSEGAPKGVVLSHRNILANAAQTLSRVDANSEDKVFNVLPVFHSFGLTGGLIMPVMAGIPVYLYPSPLHYRIVPELVYQTGATVLFGTDTFLAGYARSAHPYDFRSLRLVIAGAERVKDSTRSTYQERFGIRILEGYGITETAPVLAMNTPMAAKAGSVGRLSPGMEMKLEPVPGIDEGGRLFVKGPNVMLGYMLADKPGELQRHEGWYDTGDIVAVDGRGFITIKGRAKRFAKIAGEMVSLSLAEAIANEALPGHQSVVVAIPDARKGERLILVSTDPTANAPKVSALLKAKDLTPLLAPAAVIHVDKIPLLGSGKTDYVGALQLATERFAPRQEAAE